MSSLLRDFRLAFRTLRKNSVVTLVALASLAIGIGANTAIFTLTDQFLLRALPVRDPQSLVLFSSPGVLGGWVSSSYNSQVSFSWPKYRELRDRTDVFAGLIARFPFDVSISSQGYTERARGEIVSGNYFDVLGIHPALGRVLTSDDDSAAGSHAVAVLSHGYWMRRFGGNEAILNQAIVVNGRPFTVIGVCQAGFRSAAAGEAPALFIPATMSAQAMPGFEQLENAHAYWLNIIGRLKPGVSRERAETAANVAWHGILAEDIHLLQRGSADYRAKYLQKKLLLKPSAKGISAVRDDFTLPLTVLTGMVGLVLLIACANIANLLLARAAAREKEIAIRLSLGASRLHLIRQLLAESLTLSLAGGALGLLVSSWAGAAILRMMPEGLGMAGITTDPDARVLAFTFAVSVLTGLLFGCVPALRATRPNVAPALKEQSASVTSGGHARFRQALVAGQMALSVLLLAGAGLFAHSLYNLRNIDTGFTSDRVVTFSLDPALNGYDAQRSLALFERIRGEFLARPGVTGVSLSQEPLLTGSISMSGYMIEGDDPSRDGEIGRTIHQNMVGPEFFQTMRIPVLAGRDFRDSDRLGAPPVAAINQSFAAKYFAGRNPIGLHLTKMDSGAAHQIIAVVKDSKYDDLREDPTPFLYLAQMQQKRSSQATFYVRTTLDPASLAGSVRDAVRRLDPDLPVASIKLMENQVSESLYLLRLVAALSLSFAGIATILAGVGLYGVIAWAVARRTREIGIRMALGAGSGDVLKMVMCEVVWLGGIGIVVAAPLWIAWARIVGSQLYGVRATDPLSLAGAVGLLSFTALLAGFIPAFRASRVNPLSAIRYE